MLTIARLAFIFVMSLVLTLSGCRWIGGSQGSSEQKPSPPPPSIGVTVVTDGYQEIWQPFKKELQRLAEEKKVRLIWKEAAGVAEQEKQFEELLKQKPGAILAFMPEAEIAKRIAQKAEEKDIRLLAVGMLPHDAPLDGFVGPDLKEVGRQQGEFVAEKLTEVSTGKVLILMTEAGNELEQQLLEGNREGLGKHGRLQIIEKDMPDTDIPRRLNQFWEELGQLEAVITHDTKTTKAVLVSLAGQSFDPVSIGMGAAKETVEFIAAGHHQAEVDLEPEAMARFAFDAAVKLANSGEWDYESWVDSGAYRVPVLYTPSRVITKDNVSILKSRHGTIKPQAPDGQVDGGASGGQQNSQNSSQGQEQGKQGAKIKVKLKEGQELEFMVPGEVQSIELEGGGKGEQQGEQKGGQGQES